MLQEIVPNVNCSGRTKRGTKRVPFTEIAVDYLFRNRINLELAESTSIDARLAIIVLLCVPQTPLLVYHDKAQILVAQDGIFRTGGNARGFFALTANQEFGPVIFAISNTYPGLVRIAGTGMTQGAHYFTYLAFTALFGIKM